MIIVSYAVLLIRSPKMCLIILKHAFMAVIAGKSDCSCQCYCAAPETFQLIVGDAYAVDLSQAA